MNIAESQMAGRERWNRVVAGDCTQLLASIEDAAIHLTVTSPPYDDLREYNSPHTLNKNLLIEHLYRVTAMGGIVVWVRGDQTIAGSESGTSFQDALAFMEAGFNLHDTMIWMKDSFNSVGDLRVRYAQVFEYMFVFSKGKPRVFNPIKDRPNKHAGEKMNGTKRLPDGSMQIISSNGKKIKEMGIRFNVWQINADKNPYGNHPAVFPKQIPHDHIITWTNRGDVVLDPMCGSGTTLVAAKNLRRKYIGFDSSQLYINITKERIGIK